MSDLTDPILAKELKEGKYINSNYCIHCLNSEPYVCDIIWCTEWKKPTHRLETCEKFRRSL